MSKYIVYENGHGEIDDVSENINDEFCNYVHTRKRGDKAVAVGFQYGPDNPLITDLGDTSELPALPLTIREKAHHRKNHSIDLQELKMLKAPPKTLYQELQHGDIVYDSDCTDGTRVWGVVGDGSVGGYRRIVNLCDSSGCVNIPIDISIEIEDPVDFYSEMLVKLVSGYGPSQDSPTSHHINSIALDPTTHEKILAKQTGGVIIPKNANVWWASYRAQYEIAYVGCAVLNQITSPKYLYEEFIL